MDELIGRKEIMPIFEKVYRITSWPGVLCFVNAKGIPLYHTPSGKPLLFKKDLIAYDPRFDQYL